MISIFINFLDGSQKEVEIPIECNNSRKIKEFLEEKYLECVFDEKSLDGIEYGNEVNALVSFNCYKGMNDYEVLRKGDGLSKMYIESRDTLDFSRSDFMISMLEGYNCCATTINLHGCARFESLQGCPGSVDKIYCCLNSFAEVLLTNREVILSREDRDNNCSCGVEGITALSLCFCKSLTSL